MNIPDSKTKRIILGIHILILGMLSEMARI